MESEKRSALTPRFNEKRSLELTRLPETVPKIESFSFRNELARHLSGKKKLVFKKYDNSFLDLFEFFVSKFRNWHKDGQRISQIKAYELTEKVTNSSVVSFDLDSTNHRLLMLLRVENDYLLYLKGFKNGELYHYETYTIVSNEQVLLEARFYSKHDKKKLIILGISNIYLVELRPENASRGERIDLTLTTGKNWMDKIIDEKGRENAYSESKRTKFYILKTFPNDNFTSVKVSFTGSHLICFSRLSNKVRVINLENDADTELTVKHPFDDVAISSFSEERIMSFSSGQNECKATLFNLKWNKSLQIFVDEKRILELQKSRKLELPFETVSVQSDCMCCFQGPEDNVLMFVLGRVLIFKCQHRKADHTSKPENSLMYELAGFVNVGSSFNAEVGLAEGVPQRGHNVPIDHSDFRLVRFACCQNPRSIEVENRHIRFEN